YAAGFWHEAVNAYWGPLYSWLLALLLGLHLPGILATRMIGLASGALALYALGRLFHRLPMRSALQRAALWLAALILLSFAIQSYTPDALFTALLLLYTSIILDPTYPSRYSGISCGILGALSFYAKSYGFAFFFIHFCLFSFLTWLRSEPARRGRVIQQFSLGLACFFVLSACWIFALHGKYGVWTIGSTGEFNHRLVGPGSSGYPHLRGLTPPASEHAITAWQDPSLATLPSWNALAERRHELKLIMLNVKQVFHFWGNESVLFPLFFVVYIVLCIRKPDRRWEWIYPILTIALFSAGYIFLTVADRYFWFAELLILLVAFRTLELIFEQKLKTTTWRTALVVVVGFSFVVSPLRALKGHFKRDAALYAAVQTVKASGKVREPFASCGDWAHSAYFAYLLHAPYYGVIVPEPDADEIAHELNPDFNAAPPPFADARNAKQALSSQHIGELFVWPNCPIDSASLGPVVVQSNELKVLRLKQ
ncbi:MAG TPA: hypothetical protein VFA65_16375, partial [Bryobacteraceae bacterium]|nr:hypothetical protein [Bryobacteraceae bacterium]